MEWNPKIKGRKEEHRIGRWDSGFSFKHIRGKFVWDLDKNMGYVYIKGLGGDELRISGDVRTLYRKLEELIEVIEGAMELWEQYAITDLEFLKEVRGTKPNHQS